MARGAAGQPWWSSGPPAARVTSGRAPTGWVPPGWPASVRPPGADGWEGTVVAFLLDSCPADYRGYAVLRRHPVVLARFAAAFVDAQVSASRDVLAGLRTGLEDHVAPDVIQAAVEACEEQAAMLQRTRREIGLVEEALRGTVFIRRLT